MKIKPIFFITLSIACTYNSIEGSKRYANYNKPIVLEHPFADVYTRLGYPGKNELFDPYLASIPQPKSHQKAKFDASLPEISRPKTAGAQPSINLFQDSISLESLTDKASATSDLPCERSTDISGMTSFRTSTRSDGKSTTQESSTLSEQSTIATSSTSKFSAKKFSRSSTITTSEQTPEVYHIAPEPELWITNNQPSVIQITIYLRTPLDQYRYDQDNSLTYNSSSQRILIEPGQQITIPVSFNSRLHSIQIQYDPIKQTVKTRKHFFNGIKDIHLAKNNLNVGEKAHACSIEIKPDEISLDKLSSAKKQEILHVPLVTDGLVFPI
jgi:hypothetical protein